MTFRRMPADTDPALVSRSRTAHEENCCTCGNDSHPSKALAQRHRQLPRSYFRAGSATRRP